MVGSGKLGEELNRRPDHQGPETETIPDGVCSLGQGCGIFQIRRLKQSELQIVVRFQIRKDDPDGSESYASGPEPVEESASHPEELSFQGRGSFQAFLSFFPLEIAISNLQRKGLGSKAQLSKGLGPSFQKIVEQGLDVWPVCGLLMKARFPGDAVGHFACRDDSAVSAAASFVQCGSNSSKEPDQSIDREMSHFPNGGDIEGAEDLFDFGAHAWEILHRSRGEEIDHMSVRNHEETIGFGVCARHSRDHARGADPKGHRKSGFLLHPILELSGRFAGIVPMDPSCAGEIQIGIIQKSLKGRCQLAGHFPESGGKGFVDGLIPFQNGQGGTSGPGFPQAHPGPETPPPGIIGTTRNTSGAHGHGFVFEPGITDLFHRGEKGIHIQMNDPCVSHPA